VVKPGFFSQLITTSTASPCFRPSSTLPRLHHEHGMVAESSVSAVDSRSSSPDSTTRATWLPQPCTTDPISPHSIPVPTQFLRAQCQSFHDWHFPWTVSYWL